MSCFDTTKLGARDTLAVPGGHNQLTVDSAKVGASGKFSQNKTTTRRTTDQFLKKGTGTAGQSGTAQRRARDKEVEEDMRAKHAVLESGRVQKSTSARSNPPNTQCRIFYERGDLPIQLGEPELFLPDRDLTFPF